MADYNQLKDSADKLAQQARETAEVAMKVARDQIHELVKDPEMVRRMQDAEEKFDTQVREISNRMEEGAKQMMDLFNNLLKQTPMAGRTAEEGPTVTKVDITEEK